MTTPTEMGELMRLAMNWMQGFVRAEEYCGGDREPLPSRMKAFIAAEEASKVALESAITSALDSAHAAGRREGLEEARARNLYERTAAVKGFAHAPKWEELAESTRELYRERIALIDSPTTKGAV